MVWVQRIIWVALTIFSIFVVYVVFSGGFVDDEAANEHDRQQEAERAQAGAPPPGQGEMAYDRFLPGGRQNSEQSPAPDAP